MTTPTKSILDGVEKCGLHTRTPYGMKNVQNSQLSIARFWGSCKFDGEHYTYFPETDELIRDDVLQWKTKQKLDK